jgi:hypothetical protein
MIVRTVQSGSAKPYFPGYAVDMRHITNRTIRKLHKARQAPLAYPGAAPDSDRARRPALVDPPATNQALVPGDRVEGLGDFGETTGEFGTVEQSNEDDALVKWDDDGRVTLHQPWLKKVGEIQL